MSKKISKKKNYGKEDELLQLAFNINEELSLPEEYQLDELNDQSVNFMKKVRHETELLELKNRFNKSEREIEYNLNVNNNITFEDI
jgi:hypothetical protein